MKRERKNLIKNLTKKREAIKRLLERHLCTEVHREPGSVAFPMEKQRIITSHNGKTAKRTIGKTGKESGQVDAKVHEG